VKNSAVPDLVAQGMMLNQIISGSSDGRVISHLSKMVSKQSESNELLTLMAGRVSADGKFAIDHKGNIKRLV
jgi:hypothetical protein